MILETLLNSFIPFKTNYVLNKIDLNLTVFMTEFQTFGGMIKSKGAEANMTIASSSSSKKKKKISDKRKALLKVKRRQAKKRRKLQRVESVSTMAKNVIRRGTTRSFSL